jgi:hypothetical protein
MGKEKQPLAVNATVKREKTIPVGDRDWIIRDDSVPVQFATFMTEYRQLNGVIALAFASAVVDGQNQPEMQVCARLRFDLVFAQMVRDTLASLIDEALKPSGQSKAN